MTIPAKSSWVAVFLTTLLLCVFLYASPDSGQRVVAVGDIHGDLNAFVGILQRAQLIDPTNRWSGSKAILVQTGDMLDRGPNARGVMDLLMSLQKDAPRQGGRVIVLMGNHEAMNIYGDLRYVTNNDYASFANDGPEARKRKSDSATTQPEGFLERCDALSPEGKYGKWLRSLPAVVKVNDSIFLHGGIHPDLKSHSVDELNEAIANEIKGFDAFKQFMVDKKIAQPCSTLDELIAAARMAAEKAKGKDAEVLKTFLNYGSWITVHENGPLWYRGYAQWTDADGAAQIQELTKAFGVKRFVVGHTPQSGGQITARFDGKIYLIDTGMLSTYFRGGRASALNILDGKVSFIY